MQKFCTIFCMLIAGCTASRKQPVPLQKTIPATVSNTANSKTIPAEKSKTIAVGFNADKIASRIKDEIKEAELVKSNSGIHILFDEQPGKTQIFYGYGTFISVQGREMLNRLSVILLENPGVIIKITSHMDAGNAASDMGISQRRAKAVGDFFMAKGISPHRMMIRWYGNRQPIEKGNSSASKSKNRRIEIIIFSPEKPLGKQYRG